MLSTNLFANFQSKNLHDLFTLGDYHKTIETSDIFAGLNPDINPLDVHDDEGEKSGANASDRATGDSSEEEGKSKKGKRDGINRW